jgi:hypothetical protein
MRSGSNENLIDVAVRESDALSGRLSVVVHKAIGVQLGNFIVTHWVNQLISRKMELFDHTYQYRVGAA